MEMTNIRRTHINNKRFLNKLDSMEYCYQIEEFLEKYILTEDQINYIWSLAKVRSSALFKTQNISEQFIRKHIIGIDLHNAIFYVDLSEPFLREFKDYNEFSWSNVCLYQQLSEDFMREFADKLDWRAVSFHQKMSKQFILEHRDKLDWESIRHNDKLSRSFISELYTDCFM